MNYKRFVKESSAIRYSIRNKNVVCYSRDTDSVYMNGKKLTNDNEESDEESKSSSDSPIVIMWDEVNGASETLLQKLAELSQDPEALAATRFSIVSEGNIYMPFQIGVGQGLISFSCTSESETYLTGSTYVINTNTGQMSTKSFSVIIED